MDDACNEIDYGADASSGKVSCQGEVAMILVVVEYEFPISEK